jgi:glycerophosphoryl diester phosphodiesterase
MIGRRRLTNDRELPQRQPFLVAHRAGNRLADLRAAERLSATLVEADVRLHRGRLEVRHLKAAGPLPLLWDRWELRARGRSQLELRELLEATSAGTELVLDLKGPRMRLATGVLRTLEPYFGRRRFTVCARCWRLLEPFAGTPVRRVHSVGSARQLREMLRRFGQQRIEGVSIHERLVDKTSIASLREIADVIMTWPVNRPEQARTLLGLGVDGLITDDVAGLSRAGVLGAMS